MSNRILFVLFLFALSLQAFGQSEFGLSLTFPEFDESTIADPEETLAIDFDESVGIGLSFNHYWTRAFSTELAIQSMSGEMTIAAAGLPVFTAGELNAAAITAMGQWHFNRDGRFSPYVGAGAGFIGGEFEVAADAESERESLHLETEATWLAGAGVDIKLTERLLVNADVRYMPWSARAEDGKLDERLEIDPVVVSAGIKFRW